MAYFIAALARSRTEWLAGDVDIESATDLASLGELLRGVAVDDGPVLLLVEREDEWFAIVRADGEDDPRVFVSDAGAAAESPYAELLGAELLDEDVADEPVGDFDLLADLGTPPGQLRALTDGELATTTSEALTVIGEAGGFDDVLESVR